MFLFCSIRGLCTGPVKGDGWHRVKTRKVMIFLHAAIADTGFGPRSVALNHPQRPPVREQLLAVKDTPSRPLPVIAARRH